MENEPQTNIEQIQAHVSLVLSGAELAYKWVTKNQQEITAWNMNHSLIPQTYVRDKWEVLEKTVDPIEWCQRKIYLLEVDSQRNQDHCFL